MAARATETLQAKYCRMPRLIFAAAWLPCITF